MVGELSAVIRGSASELEPRLSESLEVVDGTADRLLDLPPGLLLRVGDAVGEFSDRRWENAKRRVLSGRSTHLAVARDVFEEGGYLSAWRKGDLDLVHLAIETRDQLGEGLARIELSVERRSDRPISDAELVEWFIALATKSGLAQGSILPLGQDCAGGFSHEAETMRRVREPLLSDPSGYYPSHYLPRSLGRFAAGPAWGLWFTREHIDGLGGRERIARDAPVFDSRFNDSGVYLQLTETLDVPQTVEDILAGRIGVESALGVEFDSGLSLDQQRAVEQVVIAWLRDGTAGAFGGDFHNDVPGYWDGDGTYELSINVGAQVIDWDRALDALSQTLARCVATLELPPCLLRLGHPTL